jgi:hypothetical protein
MLPTSQDSVRLWTDQELELAHYGVDRIIETTASSLGPGIREKCHLLEQAPPGDPALPVQR